MTRMKQFNIDKRVFETLTSKGRIQDHITSQMICNGMDPTKPYDVLDVNDEQVVKISQGNDSEDAEVREEEAV